MTGDRAETAPRGILFVVSAPSGAGKTTLVERLAARMPNLQMSRSYTSRVRRPGEVDGVDYNFVSRSTFEEMITTGAFLEWADVFGDLYGTGAAETEASLSAGRDLVLVIDVQGAQQVRRLGVEAVGVFVMPPSPTILEARLRGRSRDPEDAIVRRLRTAAQEVNCYGDYDYVVVNDELDASVDRLEGIVLAARARRRRMDADAGRIVESFRAMASAGPEECG